MVKSEEVNQFLKATCEWEAQGTLGLLLVQRKRKELCYLEILTPAHSTALHQKASSDH